MSTVLFELVTPERQLLSQEVSMVSLRGGDGELGILPRHAPLATTVKPGIVKVKLPTGEDFIHVTGGFLEVLPNRITLLADAAEVGGYIDVDRAQRAKEEAEERLARAATAEERADAEAALRRASLRLETAEKSAQAGHLLGRSEA
ncbi:MAG: F0F1 ATP synthase subunit epsilon [Alicyclobacillus herbarius]|uniref:F0F1 ATP synthase subunit epsilon n=1 Tax=Alicyclobacillus herbarius TaxID=122960 RepID=UPI000401B39A|nr:F0F1 ATP synthase subunit epsilon [Alicyclobacillus herbarius]MCL6632598.1 F0F1 ATP synthase subunit epsilon [Alicyclobacillus herbarius]